MFVSKRERPGREAAITVGSELLGVVVAEIGNYVCKKGIKKQKRERETSFLVVQWLRLLASTARDLGSIPGWGTKIPHAVGGTDKKKKKERLQK